MVGVLRLQSRLQSTGCASLPAPLQAATVTTTLPPSQRLWPATGWLAATRCGHASWRRLLFVAKWSKQGKPPAFPVSAQRACYSSGRAAMGSHWHSPPACKGPATPPDVLPCPGSMQTFNCNSTCSNSCPRFHAGLPGGQGARYPVPRVLRVG